MNLFCMMKNHKIKYASQSVKQHLKWKAFHVPSYEITLVNILKAIIFRLSNVDLDFCYFFH